MNVIRRACRTHWRWSHWRLLSERVGSQPGRTASYTVVCFEGDDVRTSSLTSDVSSEIKLLLKRQDEFRRGRGFRPPEAGEIGRIVFEEGLSGEKHAILYQYLLGVGPNDRPGWSAPVISATLHHWPGAEPLVRLADHLGRPVGETLLGTGAAQRRVVEHDVVFDRGRFDWSIQRSQVMEAKPPGYASEDAARPNSSESIIASQDIASVGWVSGRFYPDVPWLDRLEQTRETPTPIVGHPPSQASESYHDAWDASGSRPTRREMPERASSG